MGKKVRIALHGEQRRSVMVDLQATNGAVVGNNLRWADGSLVTDSQIRNTPGSSTGGSTTVIGGSSGVSLWQLIVGIPAYIDSLASLATVGFVVRKSDGSAATREIQGTAGRITTLDGDGAAGNAIINLGAFPTVQNGVYNGEVGTIPELHQMIVVDEFIFDDGILNIDGELVVL